MRTSTVRKLLPEAWGFLCPVHTPDGTPCGLLNHMSALCEAVNNSSDTRPLIAYLYDNGVLRLTDKLLGDTKSYSEVCVYIYCVKFTAKLSGARWAIMCNMVSEGVIIRTCKDYKG